MAKLELLVYMVPIVDIRHVVGSGALCRSESTWTEMINTEKRPNQLQYKKSIEKRSGISLEHSLN